MATERRSIHARTLERARIIVGGTPRLALRLGVAPDELERWLRGEADPPSAVFEQCVEIVLLAAEDRAGGRH